MKVACLGWGSLIWDSRELKISESRWNKGGPFLPIEFSRKSGDNRVTLVIDPEADRIKVPWARIKNVPSLDDAISLFAEREGTICENIHFYNKLSGQFHGNEEIREEITRWLDNKNDYDAVIWTGLKPKWGIEDRRPTINEVIRYLKSLDNCDKKRAEEYIRRAPGQIRTTYRARIEEELKWTPLKNRSH